MFNRIIQLTMAALLFLPALAGAVQLPATGQAACYDVNGNPRACLGSGEDGEKQAGVAWPIPRFIDNGTGTVTDSLTGLIWSKTANAPGTCPNAGGAMDWQQALAYLACLNANSYLTFNDWRLPNLNEMESLSNAGAADPAAWLNGSGFTQTQSGLYWTSTNDEIDNKLPDVSMVNAWDVHLGTGDLLVSSAKTAQRAVWPVRGASAAPAQLWQTGQGKCYDTAGVRTNPCSPSGQDGGTGAGALWPVPRFQANATATVVVDKLTGLVWTAESNTPGSVACSNSGHPMSWQEALDHVKCLNQNSFLGISTWRLPNRKELRSLADYSLGNPALLDGNPFTAEAAKGNTFWSSTTNAAYRKTAWAVSMYDGSVNAASKASGLLLIWPVSGPDTAAPALTINQATATTSVSTRTLTGNTETGAKVEISVNSGPKTTATVTGTNWSSQISGLAPGANTIAVTATDPAGNFVTTTATITFVVPSGSFSGGAVGVADALKALRIAVGLVTPTSDDLLRGDCSPLVNGAPAPDGRIGVDDALLILKKAIGMVSF